MTRAKDISKIITDADFSGTLDVTGDLTVDTNTLHVDSSNNRVGIGTTSPAKPLHINSATDEILRLETSDNQTGNIYQAIHDASGELARIGMFDSSRILRINNMQSDGEVGIYTNNTERMRITSGGNVGIGVSPSFNLHVFQSGALNSVLESDTGNSNLRITSGDGDTAQIFFGDQTNDTISIIKHDNSNNSLAFFTSGSNERMRIESNGEVGINETSPLAQLHVKSPNLASTRDALRLTNEVNANGGYFIRFTNYLGNASGYIEQTGATTISYVTSSDYRLKENVSDMTDATTRLKQLKPKRFNFITEPDTTLDGFLAHEVESVVPQAISGTHNELEVWKEGEELPDGVSVGDNKLDDNGNTIPKYQGIDQSKLVPLLVKTIQELEARITALENGE
jgi:hypothetical protein